MLNKKFTILRIITAALVGICLFTYLLFLVPWVQNTVAHRIASSFSKTIGARVELGQVRFSLFDKLDIQNILIRDENKDTLLYTESLKLRLSDLYFSNSTPIIKYIGLVNTKFYLHRKTSKWNYQFILDKNDDKAEAMRVLIQQMEDIYEIKIQYYAIKTSIGFRTAIISETLNVNLHLILNFRSNFAFP